MKPKGNPIKHFEARNLLEFWQSGGEEVADVLRHYANQISPTKYFLFTIKSGEPDLVEAKNNTEARALIAAKYNMSVRTSRMIPCKEVDVLRKT